MTIPIPQYFYLLFLSLLCVCSGWIGVLIMLIFSLMVGYSGTRLARCRDILEERWPSLYGHGIRQPYMDIADRAFGKHGR